MIKYYLKYRLKGIQFFVLAVLFYMLIIDVNDSLMIIGLDVLFLFMSLIVFRCIDDAGSYVLDRENHRDRIYLIQPNFTKFIYLTITITLIYLACLFWININSFYLISIFMFGSIIGYLLFSRNKIILAIIPLLKYPVLLWVLSEFSKDFDSILLVFSSFFIMVAFEFLDNLNTENPKTYLGILSMLIVGFLTFQSQENLISIILIGFPVIATIIFKKSNYLSYISH
jgi:hypothetical protein